MTALIGDIGGTNARFALAEPNRPPVPIEPRSFKCAEHETIADAIRTYLAGLSGARPDRATLAVACPILGDMVIQNNGPWRFSIAALQAELGLQDLRIVNDFFAMSHGVASLTPDRLEPIGRVGPDSGTEGPWVALGPGTGLGAGVIVDPGPPARVLESEGGHLGFAPSDAEEIAIAEALVQTDDAPSWEHILCGPGLRRLYAILSEGREAPTPEDIIRRALAGSDPTCRTVLDRFCSLLGAAAGDMALMVKARRVCLVGGIVQSILPFLKSSGFRRRFETRGRYGNVLDRVPTIAALGTDVGLIGAAALARE